MRIGLAALTIVGLAAVAAAVVSALSSGAPAGSPNGEPAPADAPIVPAQFSVRGRWPDPSRLGFRIEGGTSPIGDTAFARAVQRAMAVWSATGVVGFRPARPDEKPDVTLGWRRGHHGACQPFGPGADVAHAGPVAPGTFVHFDLDREWSENGTTGTSVFGTALHELGHVLGLGHSEAPAAVMSTDPQRRSELAFDDLAGVHSLYGGGVDGSGDLTITGTGVTSPLSLRRIAPPDTCAFAVFDCDGDAKADVVVWRTDRAGHGALTTYHFEAGPRLSRSMGPFYGAVAPGAQIEFAAGPEAARLLICTFENGRQLVRQFDRFGVPVQPETPPATELLARATAPDRGDLDGDGTIEQVVRPTRN